MANSSVAATCQRIAHGATDTRRAIETSAELPKPTTPMRKNAKTSSTPRMWRVAHCHPSLPLYDPTIRYQSLQADGAYTVGVARASCVRFFTLIVSFHPSGCAAPVVG
jgi:hypothetical protein